MQFTIFISAVSDEFRDYRDALRKSLTLRHVSVKTQEDFKPSGNETLLALDDYIRSCDATIHLAGDMCGSLAHPASVAALSSRYADFAKRVPSLVAYLGEGNEQLSYTQWEAWLTHYHGRPLYIATPAKTAPRGPNFVVDEQQMTAQQRHLNLLSDAHRHVQVPGFINSDNLSARLLGSAILDQLAKLHAVAPRGLSEDFQNRVDAFVDHYRGVRGKPLPFGGRPKELEELESWARSPFSRSLCVVAGPIGRGKSTLLVNLCESLARSLSRSEDDLLTIFVPISIRFDTHAPEVYFRILETYLKAAEGGGETEATPATTPAAIERSCANALRRLAKAGKRMLIVIDGLDESVDNSPPISWFVPDPQGSIKLLVSVRLQYDKQTPEDWLAEWGWSFDAKTLVLDPLDRDSTRSVLLSLGAPVSDLQPELTERLMELAQGEPFLLSLYVRDLWPRGSYGAPVRPAQLSSWRPGFNEYFRRLLDDQKQVWASDAELFESYLLVLACARGPLQGSAINAITQRETGVAADHFIDDSLEPLRRFVVGGWRESDGRSSAGFVLSHAKFAEYFVTTREARVSRVRQAFVDWGLDEVRMLRNRQLPPEEIAPYLVERLHFHMVDARSPIESYAPLFGSWWRDAHLARYGHLGGFIRDVSTAINLVLRLRPRAWCAQLVRLNLHRISAASATKVPVPLTLAAVKFGLLDPAEARRLIELSDRWSAWRGLLELVPHVPPHRRNELLDDSLRALGDERCIRYAADAVVAALPHVSESRGEELQSRMMGMFGMGNGLGDFFYAVQRVAPVVTAERRSVLLEHLIAQIRRPHSWDVLMYLLPHAPEAERESLIEKADWYRLRLERHDEDDYAPSELGDFLAVVYEFLPVLTREHYREEALAASRRSTKYYCKAIGLAGLTATASGHEQEELLEEAIIATQAEPGWADELHLASYLASRVPTHLRPRALENAMQISVKAVRERSIVQFHRFAHLLAESDLQRAFNAALDCPKRDARADAWKHLGPYLDKHQVRRALLSLQRFDDGLAQRTALLAIAIEWPEVSAHDESFSVESLFKRWQTELDARLFSSVSSMISPKAKRQAVDLGLHWWLGAQQNLPLDDAVLALRLVWHGDIASSCVEPILQQYRNQGWDIHRLKTALSDAVSAGAAKDITRLVPLQVPAPSYASSEQQLPLETDIAKVRAWVECVVHSQPIQVRIGVEDVLRHIDDYPESLQRECLPAVAMAIETLSRDDLVGLIYSIARLVNRFEGVDGLLVLCCGLRESAEIFH